MRLTITFFAVFFMTAGVFALDKAKVLGKETILYKSEDGSKVKGILGQGETVTVLTRQEGRSRVKNYFGAKGWVSNENLMLAKFEDMESEVKVVKNDEALQD